MTTPLLLIILDGWGYREAAEYNAIAQANTPNWDDWWKNYPHTLLSGSGRDVGLPEQQMGNSEVGHLNIGAGRIVRQDLERINQAITDQSFHTNAPLLDTIDTVIQHGGVLHLMGLLSPGGVHSHEQHIFEAIRLAASRGVKRMAVHAFLDGRDTPPRSANDSLQRLQAVLDEVGVGHIASLCGRYYAMDRDNRWDRIQAAYDLLTLGRSEYRAGSAVEGLQKAYARGENDEFVNPTSITSDQRSVIDDGDAVLFMNFRADRARELTRALTEKTFDAFAREKSPTLARFATLTRYASTLDTAVLYPPAQHDNVLAACLANQGKQQLRIAETEKYAHVTYFFNGGVEQPFPGEDRELIPSPHVATYDLQPEMHSYAMTEKLIAAIEKQQYDFIVCNFANPDMVGHTGDFEATVKAVEAVDTCLGHIIKALQAVGGEALITADHGNAEYMFDESTQQPHTAHTSEPVPLLYIGSKGRCTEELGALSDVAPTVLHLMNLEIPVEMTGRPLILDES